MKFSSLIYAQHNMHNNYIDVSSLGEYILRIVLKKAEEGIKATPCFKCTSNPLAIDKPFEYARQYLDGYMYI